MVDLEQVAGTLVASWDWNVSLRTCLLIFGHHRFGRALWFVDLLGIVACGLFGRITGEHP